MVDLAGSTPLVDESSYFPCENSRNPFPLHMKNSPINDVFLGMISHDHGTTMVPGDLGHQHCWKFRDHRRRGSGHWLRLVARPREGKFSYWMSMVTTVASGFSMENQPNEPHLESDIMICSWYFWLLMYHVMIYTCSCHDISLFSWHFLRHQSFLLRILVEATGVDLRPQTSFVVPGHRLGLAERRRATPRPRGARAPRAAAALLGLDAGVWGDCLMAIELKEIVIMYEWSWSMFECVEWFGNIYI